MAQGYQYSGYQHVAAHAAVSERANFVIRTYLHLFGAILAFALIEVAIFQLGLAQPIAMALGSSGLLAFGGFILVSWLATHAAHTATSKVAQYAGLAGYAIAMAIWSVPLLYLADAYAPGAIRSASLVTFLGFAGLTGVAFQTRKDFSFLGGVVRWALIVALLLIVASMIFGFNLGTFFSVAMVGVAGAAILYDTSNVLHHYPTDRHVGAALELFASVVMMFWYVLRLFLSMSRN